MNYPSIHSVSLGTVLSNEGKNWDEKVEILCFTTVHFTSKETNHILNIPNIQQYYDSVPPTAIPYMGGVLQ